MRTVVALLLCVAAAQATLRGLAPSKQALYRGDPFVCLDGSARLAHSQLNDDFCDCDDGSDEPGTSACSNGVFFCENKLHKPQLLPSSRVDDGICDCCDGSDEASGKCSNTCEEQGRAERERRQREEQARAAGFEKRKALMEEGQRGRAEKETKIASLDATVTEQQATEEDLRALKEAAEKPESEAKASFDRQWEETKAANKNKSIHTLFEFLDRDSDQQLSVEDLLQCPKLDSDQDGSVTREEVESFLDMDGDGALNDTETLADIEEFHQHVYEEMHSLFTNEDVEGVEHEQEKPAYPPNIQALIDEAEYARAKYNDLQSQLKAARDELETLKRSLAVDTGAQHEWAPLQDQCLEFRDREYLYKLCMFSKVTQEPKSGGKQTSLGNWKQWTGEGNNKYSEMLYDGGEKCWNGPQRSTRVTVECGVENTVLSVTEPNRCEYAMTLTSPAACEPIHHDEL
eukprot:m.91756 g.91756  ORF g.91756 m.91756 type:complete len:459 (+) comp18246_c0_seq1:23-1399(+)